MASAVLTAGQTNIAYDTHQAPTWHEGVVATFPNAFQTIQKFVIRTEASQLTGAIVVLL